MAKKHKLTMINDGKQITKAKFEEKAYCKATHLPEKTSHMKWQSRENIGGYAPMEERPTKEARPAYNPQFFCSCL